MQGLSKPALKTQKHGKGWIQPPQNPPIRTLLCLALQPGSSDSRRGQVRESKGAWLAGTGRGVETRALGRTCAGRGGVGAWRQGRDEAETDMAGAGPARRQDGAASAEEGGARSGGSGAAEAVSAGPQSPATRSGSPWVGTRLSAAQARPPRPLAGSPASREHRLPHARAGSTSAQGRRPPARVAPHCQCLPVGGPLLGPGKWYKRWISETQKTKLASPHVETVNVCVFYKRGPGVSLSEDAERRLASTVVGHSGSQTVRSQDPFTG